MPNTAPTGEVWHGGLDIHSATFHPIGAMFWWVKIPRITPSIIIIVAVLVLPRAASKS